MCSFDPHYSKVVSFFEERPIDLKLIGQRQNFNVFLIVSGKFSNRLALEKINHGTRPDFNTYRSLNSFAFISCYIYAHVSIQLCRRAGTMFWPVCMPIEE